jgi:hypothetical protein
MNDPHATHSRTARNNRRGCFLIVAVLVLLIAALAYIGFNGDPIDAFQSTIPTPS